jgi:hypothetical protein
LEWQGFSKAVNGVSVKTFDIEVDAAGNISLNLHEAGKSDTQLTLKMLPMPNDIEGVRQRFTIIYAESRDILSWLNALQRVLYDQYGEVNPNP